MQKLLRKCVVLAMMLFSLSLIFSRSVSAAGYGVHVLHPGEVQQVAEAFQEYRTDDPIYVTLPFTLQDMTRLPEWQEAFRVAKEKNIVPLVRVTTRFDVEKNAWIVPTRQEMIQMVVSMNVLDWPQEQRHVILFNEPNHAAEWGGQVNPEQFADVSVFLAKWFATEPYEYVLLPAAADLAAPNGLITMEAFTFWERALAAQPQFLEHFDAWNSHSYPNPAFTAPPSARGKNSLRGFEHELALLAKYSDRDWPVFITETGWRETRQNRSVLGRYYQTAHRDIWSHTQVVAVTPFLWQGAPGPFAEFSMRTAESAPTAQWHAFAKVLSEQARVLLSQRQD